MWVFSFILRWIRQLLCRLFGIGCSCKADAPPASCPIAWQPSALAPVFWGYRTYGPETDSSTKGRVFYPSLDGSPEGAEPLRGCGNYPLIVFCHGHCAGDVDHFKRWVQLPAELARSGFVVFVPGIPTIEGGTNPSSAEGVGALAELTDAVKWVFDEWEFRDMLADARFKGVAGHSFGALLAAQFAQANGAMAYASLSGVWREWRTPPSPLPTLPMPKFLAWADPAGVSEVDASISPALWSSISTPRHSMTFENGEHWDYLSSLPPCSGISGDCDLVDGVAGNLVTLFFSKYLPRTYWPNLATCIPDSLRPPSYQLTQQQKFYAGGRFGALGQVKDRKGCQFRIRWGTSSSTGTWTLP